MFFGPISQFNVATKSLTRPVKKSERLTRLKYLSHHSISCRSRFSRHLAVNTLWLVSFQDSTLGKEGQHE
jgi:hypothetical protein